MFRIGLIRGCSLRVPNRLGLPLTFEVEGTKAYPGLSDMRRKVTNNTQKGPTTNPEINPGPNVNINKYKYSDSTNLNDFAEGKPQHK